MEKCIRLPLLCVSNIVLRKPNITFLQDILDSFWL